MGVPLKSNSSFGADSLHDIIPKTIQINEIQRILNFDVNIKFILLENEKSKTYNYPYFNWLNPFLSKKKPNPEL
jgi:hypothetical protein